MGEYQIQGIGEDELIKLMVGREISDRFAKKTNKPGEEILRVEHLSCGKYLKDVNFDVKKGEVFGIAGLMGSGRSALVNAIFGINKIDRGTVYIKGKPVHQKQHRCNPEQNRLCSGKQKDGRAGNRFFREEKHHSLHIGQSQGKARLYQPEKRRRNHPEGD